MVPAWSLALAFVAGLVVGIAGCALIMGRGRSTETPASAAPTEPESAVPSTPPAPPEPPAPEPEPEEAPAPAEAPAEVSAEIPASAVDNVVAELERRVKGRRTDGEPDRTTGGRRGRKE